MHAGDIYPMIPIGRLKIWLWFSHMSRSIKSMLSMHPTISRLLDIGRNGEETFYHFAFASSGIVIGIGIGIGSSIGFVILFSLAREGIGSCCRAVAGRCGGSRTVGRWAHFFSNWLGGLWVCCRYWDNHEGLWMYRVYWVELIWLELNWNGLDRIDISSSTSDL